MAAGLRCGSTTIKYLLFFFNFLFVLFGLAIVVLGALGASRMLKSGDTLSNSLIFSIAVGAFIFIVAFLGCCGAVKESHCMLVTFACLLLTIIVCEVVLAILMFVTINNGNIEQSINDVFNSARDGSGDDQKAAMAAVDVVQQQLSCCGLNDSSFWTKGLPSSCCSNSPATCSAANAFQKGCKPLIKDLFTTSGKVVGVFAIAIAVIEVIGVWFGLALAGEIKKLTR